MIARSFKTLPLLVLLGYVGYATGGDKPAESDASIEAETLVGNVEAGEVRYKKTCINCHGAAGKGVASYPKVSGQEIAYTVSKLETYRDGIKIGPNSSLMIMMAKPLTDEEILDLAAYLKDAKP
jgi:cytochrome c553